MIPEGKSRRSRERLRLNLPVRVLGRESADYEWVEVTRLLDVTPFGARFTLTRPTEKGRLLHLTMPMPRQLRCFDHVEQQYRVWCLVRHVKAQAPGSSEQRYDVGVAFVGKHPPSSFEKNPATLYQGGAPSAESGMWNVNEERGKGAGNRGSETRLIISFEVTVEVFDERGAVTMSEQTVTENISPHGAAVFTTLPLESGRFVRLTSAQHQISLIAVVRARRTGAGGIPRLHLEFIDQQWPLEGIE